MTSELTKTCTRSVASDRWTNVMNVTWQFSRNQLNMYICRLLDFRAVFKKLNRVKSQWSDVKTANLEFSSFASLAATHVVSCAGGWATAYVWPGPATDFKRLSNGAAIKPPTASIRCNGQCPASFSCIDALWPIQCATRSRRTKCKDF